MTGLLVAATRKSSGKTTLSVGLCAALRARGLTVQPYKKGPDYIDPAWLSEAAGRSCINLDFYTLAQHEIVDRYRRYGDGADVRVVEANKGLFDGVALDGNDSNAALAALLGTPVLLVVDCQGMTRGIAPLLLGYQAFADGISLLGVVLNKVGGSRHESKLRAAVEHYTDLPVLGALADRDELRVPERHLGLVPVQELGRVRADLDKIGEQVASAVDIDRVLNGLGVAEPPTVGRCTSASAARAQVRIGVARDTAFGFYYADDLQQLRAAGAELVEFRPTQDSGLPDVDALFIGGGFPETHREQLQSNVAMRREVRRFAESGKPIYAECGGLMYLARSLRWQGQRTEMAGVLPVDVAMHERPQGRGYVTLAETERFPWPTLATPSSSSTTRGEDIAAHEFHYSALENIDPVLQFGYQVKRGHGIDGRRDGIVHRRVLASYAHQRHSARNPWATRFVAYIKAQQ